MERQTVIVWLRRDLRVRENPALAAACAEGLALPVFVWAPEEEGAWAPGEAARWWLARSVEALGKEFRKRGGGLVLRRGPSLQALLDLAKETGATTVFWNRLYEPDITARDRKVQNALAQAGLRVGTFNAALLVEPDEMRTRQGGPYRVFTPFWNELRNRAEDTGPEDSGKLNSLLQK